MSAALLFPGQGSQTVGMGADLAESFKSAREVFERADELIGYPLSSRMFGTGDTEADAEFLKKTDVTQPALFVHSMAAMSVLNEQGADFACAAGHSLGEYSALTAARALTFEDGLAVVKKRGALMAGANTARAGTMAAVLGLDDDVVERLCAEASSGEEIVLPANFNSPGQVVVSGDVAAVERLMAIAPEHGARRVLPLPVSGAFHSPLMEHARADLGVALESLPISEPIRPVYLNVTAEPTTDPDEIRRALLEQLTAPVLWSQTLSNMARDGVDSFVEVGTGKVLSGLVKRTLGREAEVASAGATDDFNS